MKQQQGFTLIEIAIVLVIIGLLTGGVLKGQELIKNAQVRNVISKMDELKAAVFGFQDRYRAQPGDMGSASTLVGSNAVNCTWSCDNGRISPWRNSNLAPNHLSAAGFYTGPFPTTERNGYPSAQFSPTNPWGGAMWIAFWSVFNTNGARSTTNSNGIYTGSGVPSNALAEIDLKIDDGNPQAGSFRAGYPRETTATCVSGASWVVATPNADCAGTSLY